MDFPWIFIHVLPHRLSTASEQDSRQGFPDKHWTSLNYFRVFQAPGNCQAQAHGQSLWANSSCKVCPVKAFQICRSQIHSKFIIINSSTLWLQHYAATFCCTTELTATLCCSSLKALRSCHMRLAWFHSNADHLFRGGQGITLLMGQDPWVRISPWRGKYNHPQVQSICSVFLGGSTFAIALRGNILVVIHLYN